MDKKKIAVFATGWSPEIIEKYIGGLQEGFKNDRVDIYMFLSYAHTTSQKSHSDGELNIYNLPNMKDFDGAVVIGNGMDFEGLFDKLVSRCTEAGIPTVCTGRDGGEDVYMVGADNRVGARELYEHIIKEHGCRDIVFIGGHKDNQDSNLRLEVLRECLAEVGCKLPSGKVMYTDWAPSKAADIMEDWCRTGKPIPDAFVCANDVLAMPVCDILSAWGHRVPEDVIITGFDNEFYCKIYDPAITSVDQCFDQIGLESAHIFLDIFAGKERSRTSLVPSKFAPSESCGCFSKFSANKERKLACRNVFHNNIKQSLFTAQLAVMESRLLEGTSVDDFGENYVEYLKMNRGTYVNEVFYLLLEPAYEKSIYDTSASFNVDKYSDKLHIAVAMDGGTTICNGEMEREKLLPFVSEENKENRFYIFLPVHLREMNYGYAVFGDDVSKISDYNYLNSYVSRLSIILQLYKQRLSMNYMNGKLVEYSTTDPLTHVKNRGAYKEVEDKLAEIIESVSDYRFGIAMFDINNLKRVNDDYGHEAGDLYIVGACRMISKVFKGSVLYRIGGDEFVSVLKGDALINYEEKLEKLKEEMQKLQEKNAPIYEKYSVAAGIAVYDPELDKDVQDVFNRADVAMYKNKVEMKAPRRN